MPKTLDKIINEEEFEKHHSKTKTARSQRDIFFVWTLLMTIAVIGSHFALNLSSPSVTGFVTATEDVTGSFTIMLYAVFALFVTILITAIIYTGITQKD
jgi:uncharacterized membrane protein YhaH (DUF805 family)